MEVAFSQSQSQHDREQRASAARQGLLRLAATWTACWCLQALHRLTTAVRGFIALTETRCSACSRKWSRRLRTWFSFQTRCSCRSADVTGLCTALPARLGLMVIGGKARVMAAWRPPLLRRSLRAGRRSPSTLAWRSRRCWWAAVDRSGRRAAGLRGVNETIAACSSLISHRAVNHLGRPAARSGELEQTSTSTSARRTSSATCRLDVHYGLLFGVLACVAVTC